MNNSEQKNTSAEKVICDACPILCRISPGKTGSCDRYGNVDGKLKRMDPIILTQKAVDQNQALVPFGEQTQKWDGSFLAPDVPVNPESIFPTAVGAGTTYPDYKPAPFIIASKHHDVDMVTVVTEGIFRSQIPDTAGVEPMSLIRLKSLTVSKPVSPTPD